MTKCSFCGFAFDPKNQSQVCKSCAMGGSCNMVRCPNCGYEYPAGSKLGSLLNKLWRKRENAEVKR